MQYTVKQLAKLAGVSVRTLHYYDEIGLLKPLFVKSNGYRCYGEKELLQLQQILFFRELEFPLEEILRIMNAPDFHTLKALEDQKKLLEMKQTRISGLLNTINSTIKKVKGGEHMHTDDIFASFNDDQMQAYKEEAKKRWGHTDVYKQSVERTKHWTKKDYQRTAQQMKEITYALGAVMDQDVKNPEVQKLIEKHYQYIEQFYDVSYPMYRNLGKMYTEDPRFTEHYDKVKPGLAQFVCSAIAYYCDEHEKENSNK